MPIEVAPAVETDLETIAAILREAAQWLIARGTPLWAPSDFTVQSLHCLPDRGQWIVARCNEEIAGVVLAQWEDQLFWPDRATGEAVYLHRLAVRRSYADRGVSGALIEWAARHAEERGQRFLRLDCVPQPPLLKLYESLGFARVDQRQVGPYLVARLERQLPTAAPC